MSKTILLCCYPFEVFHSTEWKWSRLKSRLALIFFFYIYLKWRYAYYILLESVLLPSICMIIYMFVYCWMRLISTKNRRFILSFSFVLLLSLQCVVCMWFLGECFLLFPPTINQTFQWIWIIYLLRFPIRINVFVCFEYYVCIHWTDL